MTSFPILLRILSAQLERVLAAPDLDAEAAMGRVLADPALAPEEDALLALGEEDGGPLVDRLLQARANRALRAGACAVAEVAGMALPEHLPEVLVVREGGRREAAPRGTVVEFLSNSIDPVALAPGAKLDQFVDRLVLANRDAAESLGASLGPAASVLRPEEGEGGAIDLLLDGPTPSIQVFDVERELAMLEELLRAAIPEERRPARAGSWSFGRDLTGERLGGKYRIRRLQGKGAFKTVYEGEDEMLGARVAVAVLNPKGAASPRALHHFQDEAKKLTTLDHENVVRWITFDRTAEGLHYFVMEFLDGEELESVLRREGRLPARRVGEILLQVLAALRRAHGGEQGALLHLDLKPENVFLLPSLVPGEPERVKVIDFGIGQHVGAEVRAAERPELRTIYDVPAEDLGRSIASVALPEDDAPPVGAAGGAPLRRVQRARGGTLLYASPEQCKHLAGHADIEPLDGRSDLYSLGVMAFRMLTGQFPFARNDSAFQAVQNHLEVPPRKVGSLGIRIPRRLAAFVDRCLEKDRGKRFAGAAEALAALDAIVHPRLSPVKVAAPVALAAALGLGALYAFRDPAVHALTLVDPAVEGVAERVVEALPLGPARPMRTLRLESDVAWGAGDPPALRLLDATSGAPLAGWGARWSDAADGEVELSLLDGGRSAAGVLEFDLGRAGRWRSGRLALERLGPWRLESVRVPGLADGQRLDPRDQALEVEAGGDAEGRRALATIEVWRGAELVASVAAGAPVLRGELVTYRGPELDALFGGAPEELELRVLARDRAGQEEEARLGLALAGEPADLDPRTGFVSGEAEDAPLLQRDGETVLLPGHALRLVADAPARARLFLEPEREPVLEVDLAGAGQVRIVGLAELRLAGGSERAGTLRIELDDADRVLRARPVVRSQRLAFRYTPEVPELRSELLSADGAGARWPLAPGSPNAVNAGRDARLLVSAPPGASLWLEASCARAGAAAGPALRLSRGAGAFELPLRLPEEGLYRVDVQGYVLLAGDTRGPRIPAEHRLELLVDRTPPAVALELEGGDGTSGPEDGAVLWLAEGAPPLVARASDAGGLAHLAWTLERPDGSRRTGELDLAAVDAAGRVPLPALDALVGAEGAYALELAATDAAGNVGHARRSWEAARTGPELSLLEPARGGDGRWTLGDGRAFGLSARARDANGVVRVTARVLRGESAGPRLELTRVGPDVWELAPADRPRAFPWWSGQELVLELEARDAAGLATPLVERGLVPELPGAGALVVAPAPGAAHSGAELVEIQPPGEYVFGGRRGEGRRPWSVELPRGALEPFFLDAREVSRAEMLAFARAGDGYADARWWSAGGAPDEARRRTLADALEGTPELPATGVTWHEAAAYAAWCGKRLPTLLEWEVAVRGPEYRQAPAAPVPTGGPASWPANLVEAPREWTLTPERLTDEVLDFASQCRLHPELLLAPDPPAATAASPSGSRWVAGAGPGEPPTWEARLLRAETSAPGDTGFRCVLSRSAAYALLDRGLYVLVE